MLELTNQCSQKTEQQLTVYSVMLVAQLCLALCIPRTVAHQAPLSMEFSRQEYWSGLPFSSPGDLPNPGIEPRSPILQADRLPSELPGKPYILYMYVLFSIDKYHFDTAVKDI